MSRNGDADRLVRRSLESRFRGRSLPFPMKTRFLLEITVADPDTGDLVVIEIHKDPLTGALFGVDRCTAEKQSRQIASPSDPRIFLHLAEPCP